MDKSRGLKSVILAICIALVILGFALRSANTKKATTEEETEIKITAIDEVMNRNMSTNYPNTPKEVIKYFGEITKCYYNETFESDDELIALADRMQLLYDDELVSYKTHEDYILDLKADIKSYNESGIKLISYIPSASTDVFFFNEDGYEWARIWCLFTLKSGKFRQEVNECFVLRKDEIGHWRIYGWREEKDEG